MKFMSHSDLVFPFLLGEKHQDRSDQSDLYPFVLDVGKALLASRTLTVETRWTVYSAVGMSTDPVFSAFVCSEGKLGNADKEESKDESSGHFELMKFVECCCSCCYYLLLLKLS